MFVSKVEELGKGLLETLWRAEPVEASVLGVEKYDDKLPPVDPDAIDEILSELSKYVAGFEELLQQDSRDSNLAESERLDVEVALANVKAKIAIESTASEWMTNPCRYLSAINNGLHVLIAREQGSPEDRVEPLIKRLQAVPAFLEQAKRNLVVERMPREWIDIALVAVRGNKIMVNESVRPLLRSLGKGDAVVSDLCDNALEAVERFGRFLNEAMPEAKGSFASGKEHFEQLLQEVHMVDMDAYELREFGRAKVDEYEKMLVDSARRIDGTKHWTELISEFKKDHPAPEGVLDSYRNEVRLAEEFVRAKDLISIPDGQKWAVLPTPEFSRATSPMGHMRTSPPFSDGLDSVLYITPIDLSASPERQKQHLEDNCYAFQKSIAFHEVIPGHHLQSCLSKIGTSNLRKQFRSTVFIEGWGLYTEYLMAEQGYLSEPATTLINLKNALWRAVRVVIDVGLHVTGMSLEEATKLLQDKVRMEYHMASGEARRYTMSPTYQSSYLLGKEQIVKLRTDYAAKMGSEYTLKDFHDKLTSYGSIPVALVRREMLAGR